MNKLVLLAKQRQIMKVSNLLVKLQAFEVEPIEKKLRFEAVELGSDDAIKKLSQELPTVSRDKNGGRRCLYTFDISAPANVLKAFEKFAASQLDEDTGQQINRISMSKRNKQATGETLYVGSSALSGLRSRFKQHCGYYKGKNRTFGLKLNKWLSEADVTVEFCCWLYEEADQDVIQLLEDGLWEELQPLFGKQGKA